MIFVHRDNPLAQLSLAQLEQAVVDGAIPMETFRAREFALALLA